jgi:hypothetical protein
MMDMVFPCKVLVKRRLYSIWEVVLLHAVANAYGRALLSQLRPKMLLLSIIPFGMSILLWGVLLFFGLPPLIDFIQALFVENDWFATSSSTLQAVGLGMLKTVVVPLLAMFMLLPLMILTALVFMGVAAMPAIVRHVGDNSFPELEKKQGGSWLGGVGKALGLFAVFIVGWLLALPLYVVPPVAVTAHVLLWAWLTSRVMAYDALVDHASPDEREALLKRHSKPLLVMGIVSGLAGALPGLAWLGGAVINIVLFPFVAALAIWMYVVIFIFTGLWFAFYCMQALADLRRSSSSSPLGGGDSPAGLPPL